MYNKQSKGAKPKGKKDVPCTSKMKNGKKKK